MNHYKTRNFLRMFNRLDGPVQERANSAYKELNENPDARKLKQLANGVYSARIDGNYRAIGFRIGNDIVWDFIGKHEDYEAYIPKSRTRRNAAFDHHRARSLAARYRLNNKPQRPVR